MYNKAGGTGKAERQAVRNKKIKIKKGEIKNV